MNATTRAEYCVIACAEAWRDAGEILASPMGTIPSLGARLARHTFAPDLMLTDGEALLVGLDGTVEGWLPYRQHLALVTGGRRHVMMGASQIDRFGNQNISCIGDWARPRRQLLGVRGRRSTRSTTRPVIGYRATRGGCSSSGSTWCAGSATAALPDTRPPPASTASRVWSPTWGSSTSPPRPLDAAGLTASGSDRGTGAGGDGFRAGGPRRGAPDPRTDRGGTAVDP
ncbi:putative CoA-transferase subunit beta [Streptomyces sp. MBT84]|nr:putative CoA-transferase subunit beta [Streptomyces sp. MBT84]